MLSRKSVFLLATLLVAGLSVQITRAADWIATAGTSSSNAAVVVRSGELIGANPVRRAFVTVGTNQFMLVIPTEFRLDASRPEKIVLVNADNNCFLTVRFAGTMSAESTASPGDFYRAQMLQRFPGAQIVNESSFLIADHSCPVFDLNLKGSDGVSQSTRIAFFSSPAGVLEFSAVTTSNYFSQGQYFLTFLLRTFRSNEGGKLVFEPFSDKT